MNALAASAAYWIASQADEVIVTPSGRAGSIGVYTAHDYLSGVLDKAGIKRTYIFAGEHKVEGNEAEPLGDDARAFIQKRVDRSYDRFVSHVAEGRGVPKSRVIDGYSKGTVMGQRE